ncbi:MAG: hypothetical protein R3C18_04485 [Planctomycetaceae bacterium]
MEQYLSVKEATAIAGKSESTIKRLIREIVNTPDHQDRRFILPTSDELEQRQAAGEPYVWKIDKALLLSRFPETAKGESADQKPPAVEKAGDHSDRIITVLEQTVAVLQSELIEKNKQIAEFQERQREQNLLLKNFQERLPMASQSSATADAVVDSREAAEEGTEVAKPAKSKPPKQSIWTREFHLFPQRRS